MLRAWTSGSTQLCSAACCAGPCSMLSSCSPNSIGLNESREAAADSRRKETALHLDPQGPGEGLLSDVRERGLEPLRPKTLEPKSSASTNSATRARRPRTRPQRPQDSQGANVMLK